MINCSLRLLSDVGRTAINVCISADHFSFPRKAEMGLQTYPGKGLVVVVCGAHARVSLPWPVMLLEDAVLGGTQRTCSAPPGQRSTVAPLRQPQRNRFLGAREQSVAARARRKRGLTFAPRGRLLTRRPMRDALFQVDYSATEQANRRVTGMQQQNATE